MQLGEAIIAGAAIVLIVPFGTVISDKLRLVVDAIEQYDPADLTSAEQAVRRALSWFARLASVIAGLDVLLLS